MGLSMIGILAYTAFVQSLFALDVQPRTAAEGGPIVFDVVATYIGPKPISIGLWGIEDNRLVSIKPPAAWAVLPRQPNPLRFHFGYAPESFEMRFGNKIEESLLYHRLFAGRIPAGPVHFTVSLDWSCSFAGGKSFPLLIQKTIKVDVEPFTKQFARKLHHQFLNEQSPFVGQRFQDNKDKYTELVLATRHSEFVPLALSLIAQRPNLEPELREFVYSVSPDSSAIHRDFVDDILSGRPKYDLVNTMYDWYHRELSWLATLDNYFALLNIARQNLYSRQGKEPLQFPHCLTTANDRIGWLFQRLPEPLLKKMQREGNLWVKTLVYVTFPKRISEDWKQGVLRELQERVQPLPEELLNHWLGKLDSDDYRQRAAASGFFLNHFDRTQAFLKKAEKNPLSAEAKNRVESILDRGSNRERDPMEIDILQVLDRTSAGTAILKILAAGESGCNLTRDAKELLAKRSKQ